jgi:galactokinase
MRLKKIKITRSFHTNIKKTKKSNKKKMSEYVPEFKEISEIYSKEYIEKTNQKERYEKLKIIFKKKFPNNKLDFISRAPGRINIIGEHIDYMKFGVLPMALFQDMIIGFSLTFENEKLKSSTSKKIIFEVENVDESYQSFKKDFFFDNLKENKFSSCVKIEKEDLKGWMKYFMCSFKGIVSLLDDLSEKELNEKLFIGNCNVLNFKLVCSGDVPSGSGLSSSSALVCCFCLGIMKAMFPKEKILSKQELATHCADFERLIGLSSVFFFF